MDPQRHARVKQVFREALRWAPAHRAEVVAALAEDDAAVRDEALSLLAHHREPPPDGDATASREDGRAGGDGAPGRTLAELLRAERAAAGWPLERVVATLDPIARELADAADRGEPHGAVHAGHVFLDGDAVRLRGRAGAEPAASAITAAEAAVLAPEQLSPALGPVGPWTDVYGLALLCVELLRGRSLAEGATPAAALARARDEAARPTPRALGIDVPDGVEAVLARALAMRPMERYQDVRRFWAALRERTAAIRPASPATTTTAASPSPPSPSPRSRPWLAVLAGAAALAAAAALVGQRCG